MMSALERLAADPAVKAALARTARAVSTSPVSERDALPQVAGQPSAARLAVWAKDSHRTHMTKAMRRGHATRNVIEAARILVEQNKAKGSKGNAAHERLADALAFLEALPL